MVDETRLLRLLRAVSDDLAVLAGEAGADADRRADPLWLRGVKYTFVTAIEASIDVAQHVCAAERWGPPRDNGDAMTVLGTRRVGEPGEHDVVVDRDVLLTAYVAEITA